MPPPDNALRKDLRFRVLRLLQENPEMSQREISAALGVSFGGVNYCLNALADKGMVKVRNFRASNNKLRYTYGLTPHGLTEKAALTDLRNICSGKDAKKTGPEAYVSIGR